MANLELLAEEFRKEGYTEHNAGNEDSYTRYTLYK